MKRGMAIAACVILVIVLGIVLWQRPAITGYTTYVHDANANLLIWDSTDPEGGGATVTAADLIGFYVNYSDYSTHAPITGATCIIWIPGSGMGQQQMFYNSTLQLYTANRTLTQEGFWHWEINCSKTPTYGQLNTTDNFTISSNATLYLAVGIVRSPITNSLNVYDILVNNTVGMEVFGGNTYTGLGYSIRANNSIGFECFNDGGFELARYFNYSNGVCEPGPSWCNSHNTVTCGGYDVEFYINTTNQSVELLWKMPHTRIKFNTGAMNRNISNTSRISHPTIDGRFTENYDVEDSYPTAGVKRYRMLVNITPFEMICNDGFDNDNDGWVDCGDADCYSAPNCQGGQQYGNGVNIFGPGYYYNESVPVNANITASFELFETANCTLIYDNSTGEGYRPHGPQFNMTVTSGSIWQQLEFFPLQENLTYVWNMWCAGASKNFSANGGNKTFTVKPSSWFGNITMPGAPTTAPMGFMSCADFDYSNASACVNNTISASCWWDDWVHLCKPDIQAMGCSAFCGLCIDQTGCEQSSTGCEWHTDPYSSYGGFCVYTSYAYGSTQCRDSCFSCTDHTSCHTGGGGAGACEWINDTGGTAYCDFNISSNTCGESCFMCRTEDACTSTGPNCAYSTSYLSCMPQSFSGELCFDGIDNDLNGKVDCEEESCRTSTFCGEGLGLTTAQLDELKNWTSGEGFNSSNGEDLLLSYLIQDFEAGGPVLVGTDPVGDAQTAFDVSTFGAKEGQLSFGFGVSEIAADLTLCNGDTNGSFYVYLDIDNNATTGCTAYDAGQGGFEYLLGVEVAGSPAAPRVIRTAKQCTDDWMPYPAKFMLHRKILCDPISGFVIVVRKADIGSPATNSVLRIRAIVANATGNLSQPTDTVENLRYTVGQVEFTPPDCASDPSVCGAYATVGGGQYYPSEECFAGTGDEDQDGLLNCDDPDCLNDPACPLLTVVAAPQVISHSATAFPSEALFTVVTNYPTNLSVRWHSANTTCANNPTIYPGINDPSFTYDDFQSVNHARVSGLSAGMTYHYKIQSCSQDRTCSVSGCLDVTTPVSAGNRSLYTEFTPRGVQTEPIGDLTLQLRTTGAFEDRTAQMLNALYFFNESEYHNADFLWTNPQSTIPWAIECDDADIMSPVYLNLTDAINISVAGDQYAVGLRHLTFKNMYENLHCERVRIQLPGTGVNLSHCNDEGDYCVDVSRYGIYDINESENNRTWWDIPTALGFSEYKVGGGHFVFNGAPELTFITDVAGNIIGESTNLTTIQFRQTSTSRRIAEFYVNGSVEFGTTKVYYNDITTVVHNVAGKHIHPNFDLFVVNNNSDAGVYVCPNAEQLTDVDSTDCGGSGAPITFSWSDIGTTKSGITVVLDGPDYRVKNLSGTGVGLLGDTKLTIYDQFEDNSTFVNLPIAFYANYTNVTTGGHIAGSSCNISFDDALTGHMTDNGANYNFTKAGFSTAAIHVWNVTCANNSYATVFASDNITIVEVPAAPSIPEFSDVAMLVAVIITLAGLLVYRNRK